MVNLYKQYPFVDENGNKNYNLVRFYAKDDKDNAYTIIQNETGEEYDEAIDVNPSKHTYSIGKKIEVEVKEEN